MRFRSKHVVFCGFLAFGAAMMAAPAAHAFTMEGPAVDNPYAVPKFDLEEQAKGFSKNGMALGTNGQGQFSTPLGNGSSLQFGVQQNSGFGFNGLGFGPASRASRDDFNRMVMPENLR
jgi:hypothetical protein